MPGDDDNREKVGKAVDDAFDLTRRSRSSRRNLLWIAGVVAVVFLLSEAGLFGERRGGVPLVEIDPGRIDRLLAEAPLLPEIGHAGQAGGVRLIEFSDYACAHCRRMAFVIGEAVASDGDLRVVMVEYPVLGPESELAARYALAAELQGGYGPYHRALMFSAIAYTDESLTLLGNGLGLDADRLRADAHGETVGAALAANRGIAAALGIEGAPAFVVGDLLFVGAIDTGGLLGLIASQRGAE